MKKIFALLLCAAALGTGVFLTAPTTEAAGGCPNGPQYHYISHSPQQCATIRFFCEPGQEPFFNDCGCGCKDV